jgi:BirA family biotin operon repressor/biotin-[acetyl-CoA-carboxylase] ligase
MSRLEIIELEVCDSTQDEVRLRLVDAAPGTIIAIRARSQRAGRGREGRTWQDPTGEALLLSVGATGPLPVSVLDELPRRVAEVVLTQLELAAPGARSFISWKAPNDLVAASGGAKVAGILVDARTIGNAVEQVVIGIGINLNGAAFKTSDGRSATSVEACVGQTLGLDRTALAITRTLTPALVARS